MTIQKKEDKRKFQSLSLDSVPEILSNDSSFFQEDSLSQLYKAIKQLSDVDKAIILLYLEEKPYKEIAKIIGTNFSHIGVKVQRIKNKLKILIN
jgi:RNA polymerase sigma-70 factor (ECF subfamily)